MWHYSDLFWLILVFNPENLRERLHLRFIFWRYIIMFSISGSMLDINFSNIAVKQVTNVSLILKDSDTESENLS